MHFHKNLAQSELLPVLLDFTSDVCPNHIGGLLFDLISVIIRCWSEFISMVCKAVVKINSQRIKEPTGGGVNVGSDLEFRDSG